MINLGICIAHFHHFILMTYIHYAFTENCRKNIAMPIWGRSSHEVKLAPQWREVVLVFNVACGIGFYYTGSSRPSDDLKRLM